MLRFAVLLLAALWSVGSLAQTTGGAPQSFTDNELIDGFKRIYSLSKRLAKLLLPAEVVAKEV